MGNGETLIEIRDLKKIYTTSSGEVVALNGISLEIRKGEIYGIIGMSGAGKSTLIRCMNRLDTPTSGTVLIDGRDILKMSKKELLMTRRKVSMIFQQFNLLMQRTVAGNIRYPLELAKADRHTADKRVRELLEIVDLSDKYDAYPIQLSGGQRQRVAIARALASDPEVLLCDEATSALDPMTTQSILALLQDINKRLGITIVLITHEMAVIRQVCTRVAILDGGSIAEEGSVDDVFLHTRSAAGKRLFGILGNDDDEEDEAPEVPALRLIFESSDIQKPMIASLVRHFQIDVNILAANVRRIGGKQYGQLLIEAPEDDDKKLAIEKYLTEQGVTVREVGPQ